MSCPFRKIFMVLVQFVLVAVPVFGNATARSGYTVQQLGTSDGLAHSNVWAIARDRQGLLWFTTRAGLSMYDGHSFSNYRHIPFEPSSPGAPGMQNICETAGGELWFTVGDGGLDRMDPKTRRCTHYEYNPTDTGAYSLKRPICLLSDRRGRLLIGSREAIQVYRPATDDFGSYPLPSIGRAEFARLVQQIYKLPGAGLLVCCHNAWLYHYNDDLQFVRALKLGQWNLEVMGGDSIGRIYLGWFKSVYRTNEPLYWRIAADLNQVEPISVSAYFGLAQILRGAHAYQPFGMEPDGSVWVMIQHPQDSNNAGGIYKLCARSKRAINIMPMHPALESGVLAYNCGTDGIVWLGTRNGVFKIVPQNSLFQVHRMEGQSGSLSNNYIRSLLFGHGDTLWVGTENGLNVLAPGENTWQVYKTPANSLFVKSTNIINHIKQLPSGELLLGTNHSILQLDRSAGKLVNAGFRYECIDTANLSGVWCIEQMQDGTYWLGTHSNGLLQADSNRVCKLHIANDSQNSFGFTGGLVWDMLRDSHGELWIATSRGLNRLIPGQRDFRYYLARSRATDSVARIANVCGLFEDDEGSLWLCTYGGGLGRYDRTRDSFTFYTTRDGLPDNVVYGIVQAQDGAYWCSTNSGLACFEPNGRIRLFRDRRDLQGNEFSFKAYAAARDGRLAFGGVNGLNIFDPAELERNPKPPPLVITAFYIFDSLARSALQPGEVLEVEYIQNFVSFEFAALDYANPAQNRYAYKLEGLNKDWVNCGTRRYAVFTGLEPGEYTFRVRGSNTDGVWNQAGVAITLRVLPPFWATLWFRLAVIGGGLLLLISTIGLRIRHAFRENLAQRRLLEYRLQTLRLQMNPHFIFNALASIEHLILTRDIHRAAGYLTRFSHLVRGILDSGRVATNPLQTEIKNLRLYLELESLRFASRFSYVIDVDSRLEACDCRIPPMLIQPYVENALRHGRIHQREGGNVTIRLRLSEGYIHCIIEDNGIGRTKARTLKQQNGYPSLGMSVTGERLELLNSTLHRQVVSQIKDLCTSDGNACGTRVELWIPVQTTPKTGKRVIT